MTAIRIYPDRTACEYGHYDTVIAFRNHYDCLPGQWTWQANTLDGHAGGSYRHKDGSYIVLCN